MNTQPEINNTAAIRLLNDQFRCFRNGHGTISITIGVEDKGEEFMARAMRAVVNFNQFTEDNDPHHEHDFGTIYLDDEKLFWKIDYYNHSLTAHSPNAGDATVTHRVLTIMLASEY